MRVVVLGYEANRRVMRCFERSARRERSNGTRRLTTSIALAAALAALGSCGTASPTNPALLSASAHPDSLAAARYVSITLADLPPGYKAARIPNGTISRDASETLAEYRCEHLDPSTDPPSISARSPDFKSQTGNTELYETTAVFATTDGAAARLGLELDSRYPACKAAAVRSALLADSPTDESVGAVAVHVRVLSLQSGDRGLQVQGEIPLTLPGGVSALASSDLVVLVRERLVAELTIETDDGSPTVLVDRLTSDLEARLAQVQPKRH